MATIQQMAQWIKANQNKIGSPEFQTVAAAYQQERQRIKSQVEAENQQWMAERTDPTQGMGTGQRIAAGAGKAFTDIARGVGQIAGVVPQEDIDAAKQRDAALMQTGAGMAGNIAGNVAAFAPTAFIPGANTAVGATAIGGLMGAMAPTATGESRVQNTAMGSAFGFAGNKAASALSRALAPRTREPIRQLMQEGVTPTPGQILGGAADSAEQAMTSVPFLGPGVSAARNRSVEGFNRAAINRALQPIGQKIDDIGYEGIERAGNLVSQAYDDAIAKIGRVDLDDAFFANVSKIDDMTRSLPPDMQGQFRRIIDDDLFSRITPARTTSGESLKAADSLLGQKIARYSRASDGNQQALGDALKAAQQELRQMAARASPEAGEALRRADSSYALMLRLQNAAARTGSKEGVFSPAALGQASRQMDQSLRKSATSRGQALMQDFSENAQKALGPVLPNSGTADRLMVPAAFGMGATALANPALAMGSAAALGTGRALYTEPAQKLIAALLTQRPDLMRQAGAGVRAVAPYAGMAAAQYGVSQ